MRNLNNIGMRKDSFDNVERTLSTIQGQSYIEVNVLIRGIDER